MARPHLIRSVSSSVPYRAVRSGPLAERRVAPGPGDGIVTAGAPAVGGWDVPRAVRLAAALLGLAAIAAYVVIALRRIGYPFPLEYLESNSLVEVQRVLAGHALYAPPDVGYVPDGYPPLYFATSAAAASVLGSSYLPLRLVSLVSSLACLAVLARLVQRETASPAAGAAAAGLLTATYFVTHTWFDVARVDSLFIALSVAALYSARWMRRTRGAVATGLLLAAVFLTKQNGLAEGIAVLTALSFGPRRRLAGVAALTYGAVLGISTLALGLSSHGWYVFYVFALLSEHTLNDAAFAQFWTVHLLPVLGFAGGALVLGVRRTPLVLVAGSAALVVESYATLVHSGGEVNDLLPAYLAVALLAGLAMGGQPRLPAGDPGAGQPVRPVAHQAAGLAAHGQPGQQRHREVRGQQVVDLAAAVDQRGVALDGERGAARDQHQGCPPDPQDQGGAGDAEHGQQADGPELPERGVVQGVLTEQHEDVEHVPAVAGEPEHERADPDHRAVGQRGDPGEPPPRAERQHGEHRGPFREPVLLGEERRREQQPGHDGAVGAAHPPRRVQGGGAERDEQRVDPGHVEPGVRDEIGRGQQARGRDPGGGARGLALHQPGQHREAGQ